MRPFKSVSGRSEFECKQLADYKKATPFVSTVVSRGRELCAYARFDSYEIEVVLIENQMAAKMAVVQGMLTQFRGAQRR